MIAVLDASDRSPVIPTTLRGKAGHILVVDDDAVTLRFETQILEWDGHHVETAKDGESAWQALKDAEYDLLVTDNIMPGLSGLALVRQLRLANFTLPVVMVSGTLANLDTAELARDPWSRIHGFVGKPFTIDQLLSAVQRALDSGVRGRGSDHVARMFDSTPHRPSQTMKAIHAMLLYQPS